MPLTTLSKRLFETWASITYWRHGSLSVCGATFADERAADRLGATAAAATRTPHAPSPTAAAPRSGTPARMATAVPPPNNPMPSGDAAAATTLGVKKRSRSEDRGTASQKFEMTAVNTWLMLAGSDAS